MKYKKFENTIIARIDKGEDIVEQVKNIALKENIKLASIQALGAINDFTVGVFKTKKMKYKKFENTIIARIDKGEDIVEQVKNIALKENIKLASIQALGAINDFTVGVFKTKEKKYYANEFKGDYEIVSLTGTINTMNGEYYSHMHLSAGNDQGEVFGGHLNKAIVSATCEMVIQVINGQVDRYFDEEIGLNLLKL